MKRSGRRFTEGEEEKDEARVATHWGRRGGVKRFGMISSGEEEEEEEEEEGSPAQTGEFDVIIRGKEAGEMRDMSTRQTGAHSHLGGAVLDCKRASRGGRA